MSRRQAHATSLTSWARTIKSALDAQDIDSEALFRRAGLDPAALRDANARYPLAGTTRLWELAIEATGDPAFGLTVSRFVHQTSFHALGYALMASGTLQEAFERLVRYFRIVTDAGGLQFSREPDCFRFRLVPPSGEIQPAPAALDAFMAVNLRMCRALAGRDFNPLAVRMQRDPPPDREPYRRIFRVDVEFGAQQTAMDFAPAVMTAELPHANPELARHNDAILVRYLARHATDNLSQRVHACLIDLLSDGEPTQERVARQLHMSLRNLQRKLREEGTTYSRILDRTREELALSYLADPSYSVSEATFLLGFSDTSSFARACRRWTGQSPRDLRRTALAQAGRS